MRAILYRRINLQATERDWLERMLAQSSQKR
jgi:hypothetical protein